MSPAAAATPFVALWVGMMRSADDPLTVRVRLDMAIWMAVFGTPWMVAAWLAEAPRWYRQVGGLLLDGEGGAGPPPTGREHADLAPPA